MPLIRCSVDGKQGWKWGKEGKCYLTKEEALKQAAAIKASQAKDELTDACPVTKGMTLHDR
jgi:hypothetical protein